MIERCVSSRWAAAGIGSARVAIGSVPLVSAEV
jgi:hypothetical protein